MRLLVTGASGLLGLNLCLVASKHGSEVVGLVHSHPLQGVPFSIRQVDLLNTQQALVDMRGLEPDAIIHCAAMADLNLAERNPDLAYRLNGDVPGILAGAAGEWGIPFVHISTDAVFDGSKGHYVETDTPNPLSVYAKSKLVGERAVLKANQDALVLRVVFFGWSLSGKRSLSEFFFSNLQAGQSIKGFSDTFFCPLYVEDLAEVLLEMLRLELKGIYHVVSRECISKYDFGVRIASKFGFNPELIQPVRMSELKRDAPRSHNLTLNPAKAQNAMGHALPSIDEGIDRLYKSWMDGYPHKIQKFLME